MPLNGQPYKVETIVILPEDAEASYIGFKLDSNPDVPDNLTLDYKGVTEQGLADFLTASPAQRPPGGQSVSELLEFALEQTANAIVDRRTDGPLDQ